MVVESGGGGYRLLKVAEGYRRWWRVLRVVVEYMKWQKIGGSGEVQGVGGPWERLAAAVVTEALVGR